MSIQRLSAQDWRVGDLLVTDRGLRRITMCRIEGRPGRVLVVLAGAGSLRVPLGEMGTIERL